MQQGRSSRQCGNWPNCTRRTQETSSCSAAENSVSGAPVVISYLSADQVLHVNTSYRDRHNGSMKPYIFVINLDNESSHWEW